MPRVCAVVKVVQGHGLSWCVLGEKGVLEKAFDAPLAQESWQMFHSRNTLAKGPMGGIARH